MTNKKDTIEIPRREIRFRAWDNVKKLMGKVIEISWVNDSIDVRIRLEDPVTKFYIVSRSECELMQFTGLLDKNGKEIYEGDILKNKSHATTKVVEWHKYHCGFNLRPMREKIKWEIIGNIYENPELLNQHD